MATASMTGSDPLPVRFSARVHAEKRQAPRAVAERPVTLRPDPNDPVDALVENLSQTGFAMSTTANLAVGSIVGLSIGGGLRRRVRIVRRVGLAYGCEFLSPLSDLEISAAMHSGDVLAVDFTGSEARSDGIRDVDHPLGRKLSYLTRVYILAALVISLWSILLVLLFRFL